MPAQDMHPHSTLLAHMVEHCSGAMALLAERQQQWALPACPRKTHHRTLITTGLIARMSKAGFVNLVGMLQKTFNRPCSFDAGMLKYSP